MIMLVEPEKMITVEKEELSLKTLGAFVRTLRLERNLTQLELSHLSNLDDAYIGRLENGKQLGSVQSLVALATALNVRPGILFDVLADYEPDTVAGYNDFNSIRIPDYFTPEERLEVQRTVDDIINRRLTSHMTAREKQQSAAQQASGARQDKRTPPDKKK